MLLMGALAVASTGLALALQDRALLRDLENAAAARLERAARGSQRLLADHLRDRTRYYAALARTPEFRANLETGHPATLRYHATALQAGEGAAALVFADRQGDRFAAAGQPQLVGPLTSAFELGSPLEAGLQACVRFSRAPGAFSDERRMPCVADAQEPQATLFRSQATTYTAASIPLVTRGRRVGTLMVAEELGPETLRGWSELTGATLELVEAGAPANAPLVRRVVRFADLELRASSSVERERATLAAARRSLLGVGLAALVLTVVGSAFLARGFVRPIREIRRATERVGRGEFSARLHIRRNDEIGDVARAFNATLLRLHESHERIRVAQRLARFGDWGIDPLTERLQGSEEFWRILGLRKSERSTPGDLLAQIHADDRDTLAIALQRCRESGHPFRLEVRTGGAEASPRILLIQAQRISASAQLPRVEASVQDVTEQRAVEQQIRYLAYHDSLTGLGNRRFFEERLALALTEARRVQQSLAVLFLDLDRFKGINDSLGHSVGDAVLQEVASRLLRELSAVESDESGRVRPGPAVARLGGDEFMVLLPAPIDPAGATAVGHAILQRLSEPITVESDVLVISCCIGIALWPEDGADLETLLRSSDTAMYYAKTQGPNQLQICAESLKHKARRRLQVEMRLRQALDRDDLELHYQPRVDARSSQIVGFEALLRWRDPVLGPIPPGDFVPIAEDAGLIRSLGRWVLRRAAAQAKAWRDLGLGDVVISVNLSPRQLHRDFLETFDEVLEETGLEAAHLELEVTETAVMDQSAEAVEVLEELRARGARIALDDFGTGYSSFSNLRQLPIDALKIDRSFVQPMAEDEDATALVAAMVSMARVLRLRVVVEGVEEPIQQELLQEMGCDELQGFLFGEAVSVDQATRLLMLHTKPKRRRSSP
jgi:diguanylate cyclase (GGDEF)-like protein